jgi:hypothetical protein
LSPSEQSFVLEPHDNLKRVIIQTEDYVQSSDNYDINSCLSFVPHLEQLTIHKDLTSIILAEHQNYDWYSSVIDHYLPLLNSFECSLHGTYSGHSNDNIENIIEQMKINFKILHKDRYQSKLIIDFQIIKRIKPAGFVSERYPKSKRPNIN